METFTYIAKTNEGVVVSGQIQANQHGLAVLSLKQKGYYLLDVSHENQILAFFRKNTNISARITTRQKAIFTHQLATLLKAGLQLTTALKTLAKQCENKHLASIIEQVNSDVENSSSFSEAISKYPKVFSRVYSAIVMAAEESGTLAKTLETLAKQQKAQSTIHSRIKSAMAYPIFLMVVSIAIVGILMAIVVPKFVQLFVNANQDLPLPTKILISVNDFVHNSWPLLASGTVGLIIMGIIALREENLRQILDAILLKLPGIGTINKKLLIARFSRTLGSLLGGGVNIMSAIETTKATVTNRVFANHVNNIGDEVMKGSSVAKAISKQEHFSEMAANMIAVGEETGMLSAMLLEVADIYDEESEAAIGTFTTLLSPIMIIFMGGIVTFIVFAILLPVFETSSIIE